MIDALVLSSVLALSSLSPSEQNFLSAVLASESRSTARYVPRRKVYPPLPPRREYGRSRMSNVVTREDLITYLVRGIEDPRVPFELNRAVGGLVAYEVSHDKRIVPPEFVIALHSASPNRLQDVVSQLVKMVNTTIKQSVMKSPRVYITYRGEFPVTTATDVIPVQARRSGTEILPGAVFGVFSIVVYSDTLELWV